MLRERGARAGHPDDEYRWLGRRPGDRAGRRPAHGVCAQERRVEQGDEPVDAPRQLARVIPRSVSLGVLVRLAVVTERLVVALHIVEIFAEGEVQIDGVPERRPLCQHRPRTLEPRGVRRGHLAMRGNAAIGKRKIGIGIDRPLEPHGRLGKPALVGKQLAEQRQRLGVGRLEGQCRPAARLRLRAARLKAQCGRQAEMSQGGARIDGDGPGVTGGSFFDAARLEECVSEVAMAVGARRIELDGSAVQRHGFTQAARIAQ